jgi:tRNA-dihydrouridine synthase
MDTEEGLRVAKESGCDGIMIGRGVFNNVFCFEHTPREHQPHEFVTLLQSHLDLFDKTWGDTPPSYQPLKRFFKIYIKGFDGASELREKLMNTTNTLEARAVLSTTLPKLNLS